MVLEMTQRSIDLATHFAGPIHAHEHGWEYPVLVDQLTGTFTAPLVLAASFAYLLLLFGVAHWADRRARLDVHGLGVGVARLDG